MPDAGPATEEGAPETTASPMTIVASRPTGPRAPVSPGPTKTAMGNYRPYRGRRGESRAAPTQPAERVAMNEEVQHV